MLRRRRYRNIYIIVNYPSCPAIECGRIMGSPLHIALGRPARGREHAACVAEPFAMTIHLTGRRSRRRRRWPNDPITAGIIGCEGTGISRVIESNIQREPAFTVAAVAVAWRF